MKSLFAFIFATSLMLSSIVPSVVVLFDYDFEISSVFDSTDEEKKGKEGEESAKEFELKYKNHDDEFNYAISDRDLKSSFEFYSNNYTSNIQELNSPPPEHI